jgi:hypothetical protein
MQNFCFIEFVSILGRKNLLKSNIYPMHAYFRNHQLYLAERCNWLDRQVNKTSNRALMKIESYKLIVQAEENDVQVKLIEKLVKDSLLNLVTNKTVLIREGFHLYNLSN